MKMRIASATIDCEDVRRLAEFWAAALEYVPRGTITEAGGIGGGVIEDPKDRDVEIVFLKVAAGETTTQRSLFILGADDDKAEIERLIGLGASKPEGVASSLPGTVLQDPEGNLFSVFETDPGNRLETWRV